MLLQQLRRELSDNLNKFVVKLSANFSVDKAVVNELWSKTPVVIAKKGKKADQNGPKCEYIYQKGKKPGQACGDPVCSDSETHCRKHIKYSGVASTSETKEPGVKSTTAKPNPMLVSISQNTYGNYEHKASGLVFNKEKKVYGKQVGEQVLGLAPVDIEQCTRYGFSFLPEAVAHPESTQPTEDEIPVGDDPEIIADDDDEAEEEEVPE